VEVRTGRCETFADCMERVGERRAQLRSIVDPLGIALSSIGTHPWSPWQEQRIIDTPHYQRNNEYLRYVVWRNNTFGLHVHVGINGADRAIRVCSALRNYLPELLAVSASSPFVEGVFTYLHSARTQVFTRMFPRCGIPDWFEGWDDWEQYVRFLYETGSVTEHTQLWWSVRPHLHFPTVEIRICDAQPEVAEARSLVALIYSLTARIARALDEGEPLPSWPHRLLEENLWRAIRHGLSGELIDFERGESIPARARIEQLVEWVQPVADELGASQWRVTTRVRRWRKSSPNRCGPVSESQAEPTAEQVVEELRKLKVVDMLLSSASMFASLAYGKLAPDLRDLEEARLAIDALRALLPLIPEDQRRDIQEVVTNLQLAYADAAKSE
jgi:carboxylate-amine ligase